MTQKRSKARKKKVRLFYQSLDQSLDELAILYGVEETYSAALTLFAIAHPSLYPPPPEVEENVWKRRLELLSRKEIAICVGRLMINQENGDRNWTIEQILFRSAELLRHSGITPPFCCAEPLLC
jgi:hypothetical protein